MEKCPETILIFRLSTVFSDAEDAVHDLDGRDMLGGRIRVEVAKDPRDSRRERDRRRGGRDVG